MNDKCNFKFKMFTDQKYVSHVPESFQDRLFTLFYRSEKIEDDFDFRLQPPDYLMNLKNLFKRILIRTQEDGSILYFNESFSMFWNEIDSFSKMILIFPTISQLFSLGYRDEYKEELRKFKTISTILFDKTKEFRIEFLKLISNLHTILNFDNDVITCLEAYISIFHQMDILYYSLFNLYKLLQIHADYLLEKFYQYIVLMNYLKNSGRLLDIYELNKKEFIQPNNLDQIQIINYLDINLQASGGVDIDFSNFSIEKIVYLAHEYLNESIKSFLTFKKRMVLELNESKSMGLIDEVLNDICVGYFSRYIRLDIYRREMINQICFELRPDNTIQTHEDDAIPAMLLDCHKIVFWHAQRIEDLDQEDEHDNLIKKINEAYEKSKFFVFAKKLQI
jgi:hypothetical protein